MRKKWFSLGCLTSFLLLVIFIIWIYSMVTESIIDQQKDIANNSYLNLNLSGIIEEYEEFENERFFSAQIDLHTISNRIRAAAKDEKISGIILQPNSLVCGYATLNEIIAAIKDFKKSGKPVIAYLKYASDKEYYLSSIADKIYLNPSASSGIILTGLGGSRLYYKDMFAKIGVKMQVIHAGKFKGYGENFVRNSMSDPVRNNISNLYEDVYDEIISQISTNRGIAKTELKNLYENRDRLFISQNDAVDSGLVDGLIYKEKLFNDYNLDKEYLVSYKKYNGKMLRKSANKIAVLYAEGSITSVNQAFSRNVISAAEYVKTLDKLQKDNSVKAIVLRVNSPGGSALESDIINDKIIKVRSSGKPVVVSMGNVAASGGYYISSNADYIVADPLTITGSIGVVMMFPNLEELGEKVGLHSETLKIGKYADFLNPWQPIDEKSIAELKNEIAGTYNEFKSVVAKGRDISMIDVEKIAQGMVWSSADAKENNLIDEIGSLQIAIEKAAELAGVGIDYATSQYPRKKNVLNEILSDNFQINSLKAQMNLDIPEINLQKIKQEYEQIKSEPIQQRLLLDIAY